MTYDTCFFSISSFNIVRLISKSRPYFGRTVVVLVAVLVCAQSSLQNNYNGGPAAAVFAVAIRARRSSILDYTPSTL